MNHFCVSSFLFLASLVGSFVVSNISQAAEPVKGTPESKTPPVKDYNETLLAHFNRPTDTASLLAYLNDPSVDDLLQIPALIRRLGDDAFAERQQASKNLIAIGLSALMPLHNAMRDADAERVRMAKLTLEKMDRSTGTVVVPAASIRLLMNRKPAGLLEALLHYLPFTTDPQVEEEIYYDLKELGITGQTIHPALLKALENALPARRATAGCIVARFGTANDRKQVSKLLADPNPYVRLRTAQGFLGAHEVAGVPTLIDLLNSGSIAIAWQAEELLHWLADGSAPREVIGNGDDAKTASEAWREWWGHNSQKGVDAENAAKRHKPCLYFSTHGNEGKLFGSDFSQRWLLWPSGKKRDYAPLTMMPNGRLVGVAPLPRAKNSKPLDLQFSVGEYELNHTLRNSTVFDALLCGLTLPRSGERMPNGQIFMFNPGTMAYCDNFFSVENYGDKLIRLMGRKNTLPTSRLDSGIMIYYEQFGNAIWHVDAGLGEVLQRFVTTRFDQPIFKDVVDTRHLVVVERDRSVTIHDYHSSDRVDLKIKMPDSIDLKGAFVARFRDDSMIFITYATSQFAEVDASRRQVLVKDGRHGGTLLSRKPIFTLLRFGF